jgi:hypothetical protein
MHKIDLMLKDDFSDLPVRFQGKQRGKRQKQLLKLIQAVKFFIIPKIVKYFIPMLPEQRRFIGYNSILTA